jgi:pimeloyl-ACP methyl ester carboxylesterase
MTDFATKESQQWGCARVDFDVPGGRGFVIVPAKPARDTGRPWIWYAPTFIEKPYALPKELHAWYMTRWLEAGIAIAGVDVGETWGNPAGRAAFTEFYRAAVERFALDAKACLLGQSRGGLYAYNWAAENSSSVRCIGGIYPVCNLRIAAVQDQVCEAYGLPLKQLLEQGVQHNPLDRLAPLAKAGVPVFHVHGDVDKIVPLEDHSAELVRRYRRLGGGAELLVIPGKGHEEVVEYFQCPAFLEFFLREAGGRR